METEAEALERERERERERHTHTQREGGRERICGIVYLDSRNPRGL